MSLQIFNGSNIAKKVQNNDLIVIESASIIVKDLQGSLVSLFQDKLGTIPQVNPFTADITGTFFFYIAPGAYNITVEKGSVAGTIFVEIGLSREVLSVDVETNALVIAEEDHGKMFNISDITGSVSVTMPQVSTTSVGMIVFIHSDTDSPIQFVPDVGVTIETAYSLNIYAKFSNVALIAKNETTWNIMGDLEQ